ncbi:hypothetical protein [Desulfolucanica intricata]|uniref:hypothetical protein n=1 Tax=Desulfolucanica intricata TaxID=1285191 RepID=UPI000833ED21|nr:hypothetical protein [Desulfolucanica intricata]
MNPNINKRPTFEEFRQLFLKRLNVIYESNIEDPFYKWNEIGNKETRLNILQQFYKSIFELYEIDMEIDETLVDLDGFIESVVVRIYHTYSTMHLVERINNKIRAKMN